MTDALARDEMRDVCEDRVAESEGPREVHSAARRLFVRLVFTRSVEALNLSPKSAFHPEDGILASLQQLPIDHRETLHDQRRLGAGSAPDARAFGHDVLPVDSPPELHRKIALAAPERVILRHLVERNYTDVESADHAHGLA